MRVYGLILLILVSVFPSSAQEGEISYFNQVIESDSPGFKEFDIHAPVYDDMGFSSESCDQSWYSVNIYAYDVSNPNFYVITSVNEDLAFDIVFDQYLEDPNVYPGTQVFSLSQGFVKQLVVTLEYPFFMGDPDNFGLIVYYNHTEPGHAGLEVKPMVQITEGYYCQEGSPSVDLWVVALPFLIPIVILLPFYKSNKDDFEDFKKRWHQ